MTIHFDINPRSVLIILCRITAILLAMNLANFLLVNKDFSSIERDDALQVFFNLFNMNIELTFPMYFSQFILFISSALLAIIALLHKQNKTSYVPWLILSLIFLFLSMDEAIALHERLTVLTKHYFKANGIKELTTGFLYFAWVIPYGLLVLAFCASYIKFLLSLPKQTAKMFILSGGIYIFAAIGMEMIGANHADANGGENFLYATYYTIEETLEMVGISLFIFTLLTYIKQEFKEMSMKISFNR